MSTGADTETTPDAGQGEQRVAASVVRPPYGWIREAAIVLGFYYVYQTIRSLADHGNTKTRATRNAMWIVSWEKHLWIYHEQSIQQAFLGAEWFIRLMNIYYGTLHFVVTIGLLLWLYVKRHANYRGMRNLLGMTTALAIIGYWSFPLAPPRLLTSCDGQIPVLGPGGGLVKPSCFVDTLDKIGGLWSYHSPVAKAVANQYAAMPSLHFGWAMWCGVVFWRFASHRGTKALGLLYPALTLFAIVVTANHWFLDALGGALIMLSAMGVLTLVDRQLVRRAAPATVTPDVAASSTDPAPAPSPSPQ
jgi:hypothetical protein